MTDALNPLAGPGMPPPEGPSGVARPSEVAKARLLRRTPADLAQAETSDDDYEQRFLASAYRALLSHESFDALLGSLAETARARTACERVVIERAGFNQPVAGTASLPGPWASPGSERLSPHAQPSLALPVVTDGVAGHVMTFYKASTPGRFSPSELDHARRLVDLAGLLLDGASRAESLAALVRVDDAPAIATRNDFEDEVFTALQSHGGSAGFMIVRISDLNEVNQRHGREVGDEVLRLVARSMRQTVGSVGSVGRIRRHEFGAVLPGESFARTSALAKELDKTFANPLPVLGRDDVSARIVVGVAAALDGNAGSVVPLFHAAYTALERELGKPGRRDSRWR
jgi:diguanylate cyclase (GGDEF)-like protein